MAEQRFTAACTAHHLNEGIPAPCGHRYRIQLFFEGGGIFHPKVRPCDGTPWDGINLRVSVDHGTEDEALRVPRARSEKLVRLVLLCTDQNNPLVGHHHNP